MNLGFDYTVKGEHHALFKTKQDIGTYSKQ